MTDEEIAKYLHIPVSLVEAMLPEYRSMIEEYARGDVTAYGYSNPSDWISSWGEMKNAS